jgi:erythromycin esterase
MYLNKVIAICSVAFLSSLFSCNSNQNSGQVVCVKNASCEIKSIDLESDNSDLTFLKKILNDDSVKIILLGEQNHYDGTTFTAKAKLIKFLHEQCGFDVLAFESGMYDCTKAWEMIQKDKKYANGLTSSILGFWISAQEFWPLADYLQSTLEAQNPIILTGFDDALTGYISKQFFLADFDTLNLLDKHSDEYSQFSKLMESLKTVNPFGPSIPPDSVLKNNISLLDNILGKLTMADSKMIPEVKLEFWQHVIAGFKIWHNSYYGININDTLNGLWVPSSNKRDSQMANNLLWLSEKMYPGKKIIVWAANFHIMRAFNNIEFGESQQHLKKNTRTMGDSLYQSLKKKMYSIVFTDFKNYSNSTVASDNSIEFSIEKAGYEYAFINLRDSVKTQCLGNRFNSKVSGFPELPGEWRNVTDGIFFINEIKKSTFGQ